MPDDFTISVNIKPVPQDLDRFATSLQRKVQGVEFQPETRGFLGTLQRDMGRVTELIALPEVPTLKALPEVPTLKALPEVPAVEKAGAGVGGMGAALGGIGLAAEGIEKIVGLLSEMSPALGQMLGFAKRTFMAVLRPFGDLMALLLRPVLTLLWKLFIIPFYQYVYPMIMSISKKWSGFIDGAGPAIGSIKEGIGVVIRTLQTMYDFFAPIFEMMWNTLSGLFSIGKEHGGLLGGILLALAGLPAVILQAGVETALRLGQYILDLAPKLWEYIKQLPMLIWGFVQRLPELIGYALGFVLGMIFRVITTLPQLIWNFVKQLPKLIWDMMKALPGLTWDLMKALPGLIWDLMKALPGLIANAIRSGATGFVGAIAEGIKDALPSNQYGTDYVPRTGLALLHKGEAVIPAGGRKGGGNVYVTFNIARVEKEVDVNRMFSMFESKLRERGVSYS